MRLKQRREREREKYLALAKGSYGSTNHGKHAEDMIAAWKPKRIVDFGCGKNQFIADMRQRGIDGIGIDFAMAEADINAAMHEVPLKADIADVVTCFDALEHLLPEDVDAVLGEMHRIAAPGGRFVFSIATSPSRITHNGENLHPTVKPINWWRQKIEHFGNIDTMDRY